MWGKWKVTSNPIGGKTMYAVYRLKNAATVDHSGNREYATDYMDDKQDALIIANKLNSGASL